MVRFVLLITANLENLTDLQPEGGCDDPNFSYCFKGFPAFTAGVKETIDYAVNSPLMKCGNCGEVTRKESYVSLKETVSTQEGTTNLVQKCKLCERYGTVTMVTGEGRPLTLHLSKFGTYLPLMHFEFRGYEPVEFVFGSGWRAESISSGTRFKQIDLSDGEFAEYDEKGESPVTISNVRATFQLLNTLPYGGAFYVPE